MPGGGGTGFVLRVKSDAQQASREISDASEPALRQQYIDLYMYSLITQTWSEAPRDCDVTISSAMFPSAACSWPAAVSTRHASVDWQSVLIGRTVIIVTLRSARPRTRVL